MKLLGRFCFSKNFHFVLISLHILALHYLNIFFLIKGFSLIDEKIINYQEQSLLDYKVYLEKNDFYDEEYLEKNMLYVASLIKKINLDFQYQFTSSENLNLDFDYQIYGKLVITDKEGKNNYYEKEVLLSSLKEKKLDNDKNLIIQENLDVDYKYYNDIATKFRNTYAINTNSNLLIYMIINKNSDNLNLIKDDKSIISITIPLIEKGVITWEDISKDFVLDKKYKLSSILVLPTPESPIKTILNNSS